MQIENIIFVGGHSRRDEDGFRSDDRPGYDFRERVLLLVGRRPRKNYSDAGQETPETPRKLLRHQIVSWGHQRYELPGQDEFRPDQNSVLSDKRAGGYRGPGKVHLCRPLSLLSRQKQTRSGDLLPSLRLLYEPAKACEDVWRPWDLKDYVQGRRAHQLPFSLPSGPRFREEIHAEWQTYRHESKHFPYRYTGIPQSIRVEDLIKEVPHLCRFGSKPSHPLCHVHSSFRILVIYSSIILSKSSLYIESVWNRNKYHKCSRCLHLLFLSCILLNVILQTGRSSHLFPSLIYRLYRA